MQVKRSQLVSLFSELGMDGVEKWDDAKLEGTLESLDDLIEDDQELEDENFDLCVKLLEAIGEDQDIEMISDAEDKKTEKKLVPDDDEDDDADWKTTGGSEVSSTEEPPKRKKTTTGDKAKEAAFEVLENLPEGIRLKDLVAEVAENYDLKESTVQANIWNLSDQFPEYVHKPKRGWLQLLKHAGEETVKEEPPKEEIPEEKKAAKKKKTAKKPDTKPTESTEPSVNVSGDKFEIWTSPEMNGRSLRQHYAGIALAGYAGRQDIKPEDTARFALQTADAMVEAVGEK